MKITDASIEAHEAELLKLVKDFAKESRNHDLPNKTRTNDFFETPSARTLRRWVKQYREAGAAGLADRIAARGNRGHRMHVITPRDAEFASQLRRLMVHDADGNPLPSALRVTSTGETRGIMVVDEPDALHANLRSGAATVRLPPMLLSGRRALARATGRGVWRP